MHCRRAEAEQAGHVMRVSGAARFNHQVTLGAQPDANQVMMDSARGQKAMQRNTAIANITVRQNKNALAFTHGRLGTGADRLQGLAQAGVSRVVGGVHRHSSEVLFRQRFDIPELGLRQDRRCQADTPSVVGRLFKDIALRTQIHFERHHDRLAQRVYRRIRDLSKFLAEVIIERALLARQHRHRRVVTHGSHRLVTRLCQRSQYLIPLFEADLKHLLVHIQLGARDRSHRLTGVATLNQSRVLSQPLFVGLASLQ